MIGHTQAISMADADRWFAGEHPSRKSIEDAHEGRVAWIVALEAELLSLSPIVQHRGPKLMLAFDDIDPAQHPNPPRGARPMRLAQATRIVEMVRSLHRQEVDWALMVHCRMGISRSAAIAQWVRQRHARMTEEQFTELHRYIAPNAYVLRLLDEADKAGGTP